jgi:eukaryotic-like serine/threonine-protein kinase
MLHLFNCSNTIFIFVLILNETMALFPKIKDLVFSKRFLKNLALVVVAYIVIVGGTILYLSWSTNHGEKIEVPNVVGKNVSSVAKIFEEADLQYEILDSIYMPNKPEGTIIEQDPLPTTQSLVHVKDGRIIRLRVSKKLELVEMPGLVDKSIRFAEQVLQNRGLYYTIQYVPSTESNGAVLEQKYLGKNIKEGSKVPKGGRIILVVGKNEAGEPVQIPDLTGMTISEARAALSSFKSIKFIINCPNCESSSDTLNSRIGSQSPEYSEGILSPGGSTVIVSSSIFKDEPTEIDTP